MSSVTKIELASSRLRKSSDFMNELERKSPDAPFDQSLEQDSRNLGYNHGHLSPEQSTVAADMMKVLGRQADALNKAMDHARDCAKYSENVRTMYVRIGSELKDVSLELDQEIDAHTKTSEKLNDTISLLENKEKDLQSANSKIEELNNRKSLISRWCLRIFG
jgi:chromosome segregation ATPase